MTFKHKLSVRLALLKDALCIVALAGLACERPTALTDPTTVDSTIHLQITPKTLTLPTDGTSELMAVAFTATGDTANISVAWSATGGSITGTRNGGGRHYAAYKAAATTGSFTVVARGDGNLAGASDTATITVIPASVASVRVTPAVVNLLMGTALQLAAVVTDSAGNTLTGRPIAWSSSNSAVASISGSGLVTAVVPGSATITAASEGQSGTATITVTNVPVATVQVSPSAATVAVGQTLQLSATAKDSAGGTLTGRPVSWASSNASIATVSASGLVTGVAPGSATVTATSESKSATATITVFIVPVASVQVSPASGSVTVGQTLQLAATPKDSAGNALSGRTVTWASNNTSVATVTSTGRVTGVAQGPATITATSEGKTGSAAVTVTIVPVASVVVTPSPATVQSKDTVRLTATLKDASGNTLTGRPVAWSSSDTTVMTVSQTGLVTDILDGGPVTITATSEGKSGTSVVTVQVAPPPPPTGAVADPTRLPVANKQLPNVAAYAALNVPSRPAGYSYTDPVTGVKVWKVTSGSVPAANSGAGHDYSDGPNEVSLGWGPNNNTHTILIRGEGMDYHVVDFTRGSGFTNYRRLPVQPRSIGLTATFSNLVGSERILYILTNAQIVRFNTATMQVENTGFFPLNHALEGWLQHDKNDEWFSGLVNGSTAFAWNSRTGQFLTHSETWLNEPRLERDGRYVALTNSNTTYRLWDLATNTFGPTQSNALTWLGHNANLRGQWVSTDVAASSPFDLDRYVPSGGQITRTRFLSNSAGPDVHHSGNWVQSDAELGGDLNKQWSFMSGFSAAWPGTLWTMAIGVVRSDGSDARLLVHHYSAPVNYWDMPWGQPSPDGKVVIFNSNMNGSGRYDLFVAEMPLR